MLQLLAKKVVVMNNRIDVLTKKTIREKLLEYFRAEEKENLSKVFYLKLNYTELADYLGVDRSVVGDILIEDHTASFFCLHRMTDFFLENLCRVRHTTVVASRIEDPGEFPQPKMTPITGTCASVRLDSLIALAFGTSRSSIVHCIEEGLVFVNGKLITSNGYEPKEGDIISVRKKGRFIFDGVSRRTKKGRLGVRILLYI